MKIFHHRVNTAKQLRKIPETEGVEIDLRSDAKRIILQHDPFKEGEIFEDWLKDWKGQELILNIKEEGIEYQTLDLLVQFNVLDYFFLDQSFPFLIRTLKESNHNTAVRLSDFESIETSLKLHSKWVWIDCFTGNWQFLVESVPLLRAVGKKLCLVSPEIIRENSAIELSQLHKLIQENSLEFDAVCTKNKKAWLGS
jgi:hypothetical protein